MTRKNDSFAHDGVKKTAPGNPAAAHCARDDSVQMQTQPGAAPDFKSLYQRAMESDREAIASLQEAALSEGPEAQYYLASYYLCAGIDYDAAESWYRKASQHHHHKATLALAGLLLFRAEIETDLSALMEAKPLIARCAAAGDENAIGAIEELRTNNGIEIRQEKAILQ